MQQPVKILVIDDDEDDYFILRELLLSIRENNFEIDWCATYADALAHLAAPRHQLYFADFRLGARSGVDLLIEAQKLQCSEPIILLTGQGNYEVDLKAMESGAVDYMAKAELNTEKLGRSIRYALERARVLKALQASERKYRAIFDRSNDILFLADSGLHFLDINPAGPKMLGIEREQLLAMNLYQLMISEEEREVLQKKLDAASSVSDFELTLTGPDGMPVHCILSVSIVTEGRQKKAVQGIIHDITNLKNAEEHKLQVEKMAAAGRLVKTIAHEVRNPLNNITLSIDHLKHGMADEALGTYLEIMERNSRRISELLKDLLTSAVPATHAPTELSVRQLVTELSLAIADRVRLKNCRLLIEVPENELRLTADKEMLKMAMLNILNNALEAVTEGIGEIGISVREMQDVAEIAVSDNGIGIEEENLSRIFEPYFTGKKQGIGLGLTLTMNILQAYRATLSVKSKKGLGTVFSVRIPVRH